jgi:hypothetical protein
VQRLQLGLQFQRSTRFAHECVLQRRQPVERGGRQPTFFGPPRARQAPAHGSSVEPDAPRQTGAGGNGLFDDRVGAQQE